MDASPSGMVDKTPQVGQSEDATHGAPAKMGMSKFIMLLVLPTMINHRTHEASAPNEVPEVQASLLSWEEARQQMHNARKTGHIHSVPLQRGESIISVEGDSNLKTPKVDPNQLANEKRAPMTVPSVYHCRGTAPPPTTLEYRSAQIAGGGLREAQNFAC